MITINLSNGIKTGVYSFNIIIATNQPPSFSASLATQNLLVGTTVVYTIPSYSDPEGQTVTFTTNLVGSSSLPTFVTYSGGSYNIAPNSVG
jgi:hypothetical protein